MKLDKISLIAAGAVLMLSSCVQHPGEPLLYNNQTKVDTEGFRFFKIVHEAVVYEVGLANHISATATSPDVKKLANQVIETYQPVIPELVELATTEYVILPDPGAVVWRANGMDAPDDSLQTADMANERADVINEQNYVAHVQQKQALIVEQFNRLSRNTNRQLRDYAAEKLPTVQELYALAGGEADHGAHH